MKTNILILFIFSSAVLSCDTNSASKTVIEAKTNNKVILDSAVVKLKENLKEFGSNPNDYKNYKRILGRYTGIASGDNFYYCFDTASTPENLIKENPENNCFFSRGEYWSYPLTIDAPQDSEDSDWGYYANPKFINSFFELFYSVEEVPWSPYAEPDDPLLEREVIRRIILLRPG